MTIACATHFTDSSSSAVRVAAALARKHREPLLLINVQLGAHNAPHGQALETAALNALKSSALSLASRGLEVSTAVLRGPLGPTVGQYCHDHQVSLLVIGDTNHLTGRLFENALDQLAYGTRVPVLVVRDDVPLLDWIHLDHPLKVLLALDRTWTSALARDWVHRLSEFGPLELVASHVWWPPTEYQRRGLARPVDTEGHMAIAQIIRADVAAALRSLPANVTHRVHLEIGHEHVSERLLAFSVAEQVDVFVVGAHPQRGRLARLWSVSHDVLGLAPMSVVCVPGAGGPATAAAAPP